MSETLRKRISESEKHIFTKLFMGFGLAFMLYFVLIKLKIIFLPMLLAFFFTCLLNPVVVIFQKWKFPRSLAIIITLLLGICVFWLSMNFIAENIIGFQQGITSYAPKYKKAMDAIMALKEEPPFSRLAGSKFDFLTVEALQKQLENISITGIVQWLFSSIFSFTGYFLLTIIFLLYFLPALPSFPGKLKKAFPGEKGIRLCDSVEIVIHKVQNYIFVKFLTSLGLAFVTGVISHLFDVDFASTWAIFAFFLNFIPTVGSVLCVILPVLFGIVQMGFGSNIIWLAICLSVPSAIFQNYLEPVVLGRSVDLSPVTAMIAILLWSVLWGGIGAIVAVPATAVIKLTFDNDKDLKPLGYLMGN
jgi:predicted PurR-regulated permease PerM